MKFVEVVVHADATVEETWTLQVPDSANVTEDNALELIGGRYTHSVTNEVFNEDNRQVVSVSDMDAPDDQPALNLVLEFIQVAGLETRLNEYLHNRTALEEGWR